MNFGKAELMISTREKLMKVYKLLWSYLGSYRWDSFSTQEEAQRYIESLKIQMPGGKAYISEIEDTPEAFEELKKSFGMKQ